LLARGGADTRQANGADVCGMSDACGFQGEAGSGGVPFLVPVELSIPALLPGFVRSPS
jgi:hypothetical protein